MTKTGRDELPLIRCDFFKAPGSTQTSDEQDLSPTGYPTVWFLH
jgi:hypothetical protein